MDASADVLVDDGHASLGRRLTAEVLAPLKAAFVAKDEIIDLLGVCLVAGENLFILGPPGTAKLALVQEMAARIDGRVFDYLLTRFTEPNELFGPFDIRKLREGELITNTEGMLPEASLVFLDELLNANSAILNSLLMVLNERVFRRGRETRALPLLMAVGASNRLPEDDALGALFDRFLMRVRCDNIAAERMQELLTSGWKLDLGQGQAAATFSIEDVRRLHAMLADVDLSGVRPAYVELIHRLRYAGIPVSDRRAVKLQRLMAASALLCGRLQVNATDLWVLRYIWDAEDQQEVLASLVQEAVDKGSVHAGRPIAIRAARGRRPRPRVPRPRSGAHCRPPRQGSPRRHGAGLLEGPPRAAGRPLPMGGRSTAANFSRTPDRDLVEAVGGRAVSSGESAGGKATIASGAIRGWAVRLAPAQVAAAGRLRLAPGIEVCEAAEGVWFRGERLEKGIDERLRSLPGARRFQVLADGQLLAAGDRVPGGWIPDGPWTPLARWLGIELPPPGAAAQPGPSIPLELCRSSDFQRILRPVDDHGPLENHCGRLPAGPAGPLAFCRRRRRRRRRPGTPPALVARAAIGRARGDCGPGRMVLVAAGRAGRRPRVVPAGGWGPGGLARGRFLGSDCGGRFCPCDASGDSRVGRGVQT